MSTVVLQQAFEKVANHGCSGYVHDNSNNTQLKKKEQTTNSDNLFTFLSSDFNNPKYDFHTHHDEENIQTVPQALEVMQAVDVDLQHLLHHVVQDE